MAVSVQSQQDIVNCITKNQSNWMGAIWDIIQNMPLSSVCLPGSHDSGMYAPLSMLTEFGTASATITQTITILEQLQAGYRYFDFRPTLTANSTTMYLGHFSQISTLGWQGACGVTLQQALQDIETFCSAPENAHEIIIVRFSHYNNTAVTTAISDNYFTQENYQSLNETIVSSPVAKYLVKSATANFATSNFANTNLSEILKLGQVLAIFDDVPPPDTAPTATTTLKDGKTVTLNKPQVVPLVSASTGCWPGYCLPSYGAYSHTDNLQQMMSGQGADFTAQFIPTADKSKFVNQSRADWLCLISWTLTQAAADAAMAYAEANPGKTVAGVTAGSFVLGLVFPMLIPVLWVGSTAAVGATLQHEITGKEINTSVLELANKANAKLSDLQGWCQNKTINPSSYPNVIYTDNCTQQTGAICLEISAAVIGMLVNGYFIQILNATNSTLSLTTPPGNYLQSSINVNGCWVVKAGKGTKISSIPSIPAKSYLQLWVEFDPGTEGTYIVPLSGDGSTIFMYIACSSGGGCSLSGSGQPASNYLFTHFGHNWAGSALPGNQGGWVWWTTEGLTQVGGSASFAVGITTGSFAVLDVALIPGLSVPKGQTSIPFTPQLSQQVSSLVGFPMPSSS